MVNRYWLNKKRSEEKRKRISDTLKYKYKNKKEHDKIREEFIKNKLNCEVIRICV